jgi:hypothetical protein
MTLAAGLAALILVTLHRLDGGVMLVNPRHITSLHSAARHGQNKVLHSEAHCAVSMSDGKIVAVLESCIEVKRLLEGADR